VSHFTVTVLLPASALDDGRASLDAALRRALEPFDENLQPRQ